MRTRVDKSALVEILTINRAQHRALFEEAIDAYRDKLIEVFTDKVERLKAGDVVEQYVRLPQPEDHTNDYDRILAMLDLSTEDTVELDETDVAQYVKDDWGWKQSFAANTMSYTSAAR